MKTTSHVREAVDLSTRHRAASGEGDPSLLSDKNFRVYSEDGVRLARYAPRPSGGWMRILGITIVACLLAAPAARAQSAGTITGQVRAQVGDVPVSGARISVAGTTREITTGADGRFVLTGVPAGSVTVVVTRDGYAPLSQPITVTAGQSVTLDVQLPAAP